MHHTSETKVQMCVDFLCSRNSSQGVDQSMKGSIFVMGT